MTTKLYSGLHVDLSYTTTVLPANAIEQWHAALLAGQNLLEHGQGAGEAMRGWVHLPKRYPPQDLQEIQNAALTIRANSAVLLVAGIGGSYVGTRAALEYLTSPLENLLPEPIRQSPQILFVGNNLSATTWRTMQNIIGDRDFSVNVISHSGTTIEPLLSFNLWRQLLEERYSPDEARQRIYVTTNSKKGYLRELAAQEQYASFVIPDDVGGRYSLLTPVGFLALAVAGIPIQDILLGAKAIMPTLRSGSMADNPAFQYVAARHALHAAGRNIELFGCYEPSAKQLGEWWKQLFGESEGKDRKGIFPATLELPADLHSMGQYIQDGPRIVYNTLLDIQKPQHDVVLHNNNSNPNNPLAAVHGLHLNAVNRMVQQAACQAHADDGVASILIRTLAPTPYHFGALIYFFEYACALSAYVLGVNPFNQPGVEAYKKQLHQLIRHAQNTP